MKIPGAYEISPQISVDERGSFHESYRYEMWMDLLGEAPVWKQGNTSVSNRGCVRGIHFGLPSLGQAKYVSLVRGAARDYVIDLRPGSGSFGEWDLVELDDRSFRSVYIAPGLGHLFEALEDTTTLTYLQTQVYTPAFEYTLHPLDPEIGLELQTPAEDIVLSDRDRDAPSFAQLRETLLAAGRGV